MPLPSNAEVALRSLLGAETAGLIVAGVNKTDGVSAGSTAALVGFFGVTPVARPAAYTQTYATASRSHPDLTSTVVAAADAVNAPAGGTGTAAGGWDTAGNRDAAIAVINSLVTLANETKADFNALRTDLDNLKQLVNSVIDDLQSLGLLQ